VSISPEDAERMAKRFHETWQTLTPRRYMIADYAWDQVDFKYRQQLVRTFEELGRAEVIFPGPSLYAEP
jgi:hypothetical protein